jgi:secreted trypsin-like serine protease
MGNRIVTLALLLVLGLPPTAGATVIPLFQAGAPPDSPATRVNPNVATSPFTGVVSINIRFVESNNQQASFICSGVAISPFHVLTAAHCGDPLGNGVPVDITQTGNDIRVILNDAEPFTAATDLITANQVTLHPDYNGFNVCPGGTTGCKNDDLAIIRLPTALPATVQIYSIYDQVVTPGAVLEMVGYGTSGNGIFGYTVGPSFFVKRSGANVFDVFDRDDEQNFASTSAAEVWYYDFDGTKNGVNRDTFCLTVGVCSPQLPNNVETLLGGGDSGAPAFIRTAANELLLAATATFADNVSFGGDPTFGDFGDTGGGILLNSYRDWIVATTTTTAAPEPGSLALLALSLGALAAFGRRRVSPPWFRSSGAKWLAELPSHLAAARSATLGQLSAGLVTPYEARSGGGGPASSSATHGQ